MDTASPSSRQRMLQQFIRFFVVGIGATLLHLAVYLSINEIFGLREHQTTALNISYGVGYALSFVANYIVTTRWTFQTKASVKKGAGFALSHGINFGLHLLLFNVFFHLRVHELIAALNEYLLPSVLLDAIPQLREPLDLLPLPIYVIVVPVNFLLVRFFLTAGGEKAQA